MTRSPERASVSIIIAHVVLLALVLGASFAISEVGHCAQPEPLCTEEWRQDAGRPAPCSGILRPTKGYAELLGIAADLASCKETAARDAETCAAEKAALQKKLDDANASRIACENAQIPEPPPKPKERPSSAWPFVGGVLAGAAIAVAVIYAVR